MEQDILTLWQKKVIELVSKEPNAKNFYLTGGTALAAYYLHHRYSDDLDFFTFGEPDRIFVHSFAEKIKSELSVREMRFERLYDRSQFFYVVDGMEVKIEFTKYPFKQLEKPREFDGIKVDGLKDIAANKLTALVDRFDPKDFVDLYFLLQKFTLDEIRKAVEQKFGHKFEAVFLGGELVKARKIQALPKMIKPLTIEELKTFFADLAKSLAPEILKN